jgi:hypothetical protein
MMKQRSNHRSPQQINKPNNTNMKSIIKLTFLAATVTVVATNAALADNHPMQLQLALQRTQSAQSTSIATYAGNRGIGSSIQDMRCEVRFEQRINAHGEIFVT